MSDRQTYSLVQCVSCSLQDDYGTVIVTYSQGGCDKVVRISVRDQMLAGLEEHVRISHINNTLRETERITRMRFCIAETKAAHPIFTDEEEAQLSSISIEDFEEVWSYRAQEQFQGYDKSNNRIYAKTELVLA